MADRVNPMIFVDIPATDPEAMSAFYHELFGWHVNRRPAGEFHEILPGLKPNLGIHLEATPMRGPVPRIYVMVDEPPTYLAEAVRLGATVLWEERLLGRIRWQLRGVRDPWGMEVCLWRDKGTYTTATQ